MNFGLPFTFIFQDPEWIKKIILVALVGLIPIIGWLVILGWSLEITRRIIIKDPMPLPSLNFGADLGRGFKGFVIAIVYALPIVLLAIVIAALSAIAINAGEEFSNIISIILSLCSAIFSLVYGIALAFMLPAALGRFADTERISAGLKFGQVFKQVKAAPLPYLIVIAGAFVGGIIAPLGGILCVIGSALTMVYSQAITAHFTGQAYLQATEKIE